MKLKYYIITTLSMLAVSACTNDDPLIDGQRNIMFHTTASTSKGWTMLTRATHELEALPEDYKVSVSAMYRPDSSDTDNHIGASLRKQPLTHVSTSEDKSSWVAANCSWPTNGTLDFISWATSGDTHIDPTHISFNAQNDFSSDFQGMQIDLHAADGTEDILFSTLAAHATSNDGAVPLNFHHATTCLVVSLKAADQTTVEHFGLSSVALDSTALAGKLNVTLAADTTLSTLTSLSSFETLARWSEIDTLTAYHLPAFDSIPLQLTATTQSRFLVPELPKADFIISYTIDNSTAHSFVYHSTDTWQQGMRHCYNFTVTLKKIIVGAEEENWNTEIGGGAYEPDWNVEVSTGAAEATWNEEIGGDAYEVTWRVEIATTALEAEWVSEIGGSALEDGWNGEISGSANEENWNSETSANANEEDWNSETSTSANEEGWNSETSTSANEEKWNAETSGGAYEEEWTPGGETPVGESE